MISLSRGFFPLCGLALLLGVLPQSQAATITATYNGPLNGTSVDRTILDGPTYGLPGTATSVVVSLLSFSTPGFDFLAYCIEAQQLVGSATFTIDPTFALVPGNINPPTALTATQIGHLQLLLGQVADPFSASLSPTLQAAIQIGIWEIVRETSGSYNVAAGNVFFANPSDPSILTTAQSFLNNVSGGIGTPNTGVQGLYDRQFQDLLTSVPEPGTLAMMSFTLCVIGLRLRRRG